MDNSRLPESVSISICFLGVLINDPSFNYQKYTNLKKIIWPPKTLKPNNKAKRLGDKLVAL